MKNNKKIMIGVCGGIASYKTAYLVRILVKNGLKVKIVMTEAATKFIRPLVFTTLSNNPVYCDMFAGYQHEIEHISLAQWADLCVIAPLSANTLSKIATGICDNLLTATICALPKTTKIICAPAMNENMWANSIIQENIKKLKSRKQIIFLPPKKGELACGIHGKGKMCEAEEVYKKIVSVIN